MTDRRDVTVAFTNAICLGGWYFTVRQIEIDIENILAQEISWLLGVDVLSENKYTSIRKLYSDIWFQSDVQESS
jgi:hypothetical protein